MGQHALWIVVLFILALAGILLWRRSLRRLAAQKDADLRACQQLCQTMFQVTGTGMVSFGEDAIIESVNDEFTVLSGSPAEEVEGKTNWLDFFPEESRAKMKRLHRDIVPGAALSPRSCEAQFLDRQGRIHDGLVTLALVPGSAQRLVSFLDTTEVKRAQQQMYRSEKMAALGQIIAGVAHEINNPNNFVHFNLPILKQYIDAIRPTLDENLGADPNTRLLNMSYGEFIADLYKLIANMQHGSSRITEIVGELKSYIGSHESKGKQPGSLHTVIHRAMTLVGKQVRKMVKTFETEIEESLPPIMMNAGRIEQVLINLLINAGQAADKEDSWVRLGARLQPDAAVEITVEDNGAGIAEEDLPMIFDPFFSRKSRASGTGLGLAITQRILEDHHGTITVESTRKTGTRFVVRLPVIKMGGA